jgi:glyoxylase-like metal-dependent hydrolase (beta-lactamase superfamily II)
VGVDSVGGVVVVAVVTHLERIVLGGFQAYLWRDADRVTLIDTGVVGGGIVAGLAEAGLVPGNVDRVVLTHFHGDHAGGAAELAAGGVGEIVAHEADAPVVRGHLVGAAPVLSDVERELYARVAAGVPAAPAVRVDRTVRDGDVLDFGGGAHVIGTPGHTDGSIAVLLPTHGVLFTGDIAAEHGGVVGFGVFHVDREAAAVSFARLAGLDVAVACFGHGEPVTTGAGTLLRRAAARH